MTSTGTIPRFLLPQRSQMWRRVWAPQQSHVRFASSAVKPPPPPPPPQPQKDGQPERHTVLEKPERFNPPSHGARLPKKGYVPRTYGGELSAEQVRVQSTKDYPGMPPPQGSRAHRIIHNKWLHVCISIGTLTILAGYTFAQNFMRTSPYVDMIPTWSELLWHPFSSLYAVFDAMRLTTIHQSAISNAQREKALDDALKRKRYRKAHGIDEPVEITSFFKGPGPVEPENEVVPQDAASGTTSQRGK